MKRTEKNISMVSKKDAEHFKNLLRLFKKTLPSFQKNFCMIFLVYFNGIKVLFCSLKSNKRSSRPPGG